MISSWKVARELKRIVEQAHGVLAAPYEVICRQLHRGVTKRSGDLAGISCGHHKDVAIFAIYQPQGLSESTFTTLRHLGEEGYATVVVSNAPLTASDLRRLSQNATAVYQRKNFGYDMGAFQDVLRLLPGMGATLNSLILINDSIWFPIRSNSRLIEQMRANPAAAVAAQMFRAPPHRSAGHVAADPILGSYLMMFKGAALISASFQNFWRDYRMSSNKEITIRRGERGLSTALHRGGVSMSGVYSDERFLATLMRCSSAELFDSLGSMILFKAKDRARRADLLSETRKGAAWDGAARKFIQDMAVRKNVTSVLPTFCVERLGVDIVKKNNEMHYRLARRFLSLALKDMPYGSLLRPFLHELDAATEKDELPAGLYAMCCSQGADKDLYPRCGSAALTAAHRDLVSESGQSA